MSLGSPRVGTIHVLMVARVAYAGASMGQVILGFEFSQRRNHYNHQLRANSALPPSSAENGLGRLFRRFCGVKTGLELISPQMYVFGSGDGLK